MLAPAAWRKYPIVKRRGPRSPQRDCAIDLGKRRTPAAVGSGLISMILFTDTAAPRWAGAGDLKPIGRPGRLNRIKDGNA